MNILRQCQSGLISTQEDVYNLSKKASAKILVISDTHGDFHRFSSIMEAFAVDCDALVFCGDGIYDLINCIEQAENDKSLQKKLPSVIAAVRGNGDLASNQVFSSVENTFIHFEFPETLCFTIAEQKILVVHGHRYSVDFGTESLVQMAEKNNVDIVFYGHTHRGKCIKNDSILFVNPGSCSRPRGGMKPSIAVVTIQSPTKKNVEFFSISENLFGGYTYATYTL